MGLSNSVKGMTEEMLNEYKDLTFLTKSEILKLYKIFLKFGADRITNDIQYRFPIAEIKENFPQIKYNPFRFQIYKVFSSKQDMRFSFEDMLDLCSVMSENCPSEVKATWAFRIFDFNGDGAIGKDDLMVVVDRLTQGLDPERVIDIEGKEKIIQRLLKGMDMEGSGTIAQLEFEHAVSKMMDFSHSFSFRI